MTTEITESECFALLADRRRRTLVRTLDEVDTALSIDELAERIADREYERPTGDDPRTVRISLAHNHLPRLEDHGVVSYDRDARTVSLRPSGTALVDHLRRVDDESAAGSMPNASSTRFSTSPSGRR